MTSITMSAPAATISETGAPDGATPSIGAVGLDRDHQKQSQFLARLTGLLFIVTFVASILPVEFFYGPVLGNPAFVLGRSFDVDLSSGALFELILIVANIGTALALYPVLAKRFPALSLGYVAARLVECGFIALGIVALLTVNTLRANAGAMDHATLAAIGQALVAVHDWTFRLGPGVVVGAGNGLILGYLMWRSRLVPRFLSILGLVGGPLILISGAAVLLGTIGAGSMPQVIATIPEFLWELSLGVWLLARGFAPKALAALDAGQA